MSMHSEDWKAAAAKVAAFVVANKAACAVAVAILIAMFIGYKLHA